MHIVDLFIVRVDGYKEKDVFFTLSGTIKDVDVFWNSVIKENVTSIYLLTDPNSGNSLILPEESGEIKLETTSVKRVISSKGEQASRTKSRVKRYKTNGKKVLTVYFFYFTVIFLFCFCLFFLVFFFCFFFFLSKRKQILYTMTQMLQNERTYFIFFMVDKVVSKTSFVCFRCFSRATKRSNGIFRSNT